MLLFSLSSPLYDLFVQQHKHTIKMTHDKGKE